MAGDEISGDVGKDGKGVAVGKDINQTSNTGGGATVHLQASPDTLSNIYYLLSDIKGEVRGHGDRMTALERRMANIESGRPIDLDMQTRWLLVIIIVLIILLAWSWSSEARGGAVAMLLLVQWLTAAMAYLRQTISWI